MADRPTDRRAFIKSAVAGAAAMAIPGCGQLRNPNRPIRDAGDDRPGAHDDLGGANPRDRPPTSTKPNVLFVFDDQLRADVCGVYGGRNITTPNIDRLANAGVRFTNSVSSCPLCTPYRGMVQTGRYPTHSGIVLNFVEANHVQNPNCLADLFAAAGYETGFIGKWHLASGWRREEGLYEPNPALVAAYQAKNPETEYVPPGTGRLGYAHWQAFNFHANFNSYYYYEDEAKKIFSDRYETDTETDQAIAHMEKCRQSGRPFFLSVAPHPPHPPFDPAFIPAGYLEQVPEKIWWSPNVPANRPRSDEEMRYYLAMAKNVDDNLGRLMDYLETSGLASDTIVVFTADHGEMHGSHGRLNKMVPYAEAINIPLVVRWPQRIAARGPLEILQTPMDHLPTLCGLAGLTIPGEVDGADLSKVILGEARDAREEVLIGSYTSDWDFCQTGTSWPEWRGVKTKQYTYCRWLAGSEELYDNLADPYQMENLVERGPQVLAKLRSRLSDLLAAAHDDFRPGTGYGEWYDDRRNLVQTGLGPVPG
jgi:arylsulfatase A-like enzyme